MRIALIGEYSNVHATLAKGLRTLGHEVVVVSNGDFWKNYTRDIDVSRGNKWYSNAAFAVKIAHALMKIRNFDVVQFINPMFFELKAERLFPIFNYIKRNNKRVVLGAFGMDHYWVKACVEKKFMRYSDFNFGDTLRTDEIAMTDRRDWLSTKKEELNVLMANECDAIVSGLWEYQKAYEFYHKEKTQFIPYPIVLPENDPEINKVNKPIKILIGINKTRSVYKGTDIMLKAACDVQEKHQGQIELQVVENVPFNEYVNLVKESDILLDQLYSYTPAMNALMAMSMGIAVVGGGEPEQYEILEENELRPIVNIIPDFNQIVAALESLISDKERLIHIKKDSLEYIKRHHDCLKVAKKYESLYKSILNK